MTKATSISGTRGSLQLPEYVVHDPDENGYKYTLVTDTLMYTCPRTQRTVTVYSGYGSDGATGAIDIRSSSWWIHDRVCKTGEWDNGDKMTNLEASTILSRILWEENHKFRSGYWFFSTLAFGGDKARDNGIFKLKKVSR